MTGTQRSLLRQALRDERREAVRRLDALRQSYDELIAFADLEPADDEHDPDGTTAYERAQVASMITEQRMHVARLDSAATRLDEDGFGQCAGCAGSINFERLQAVPEAVLCVDCAATAPLPTTHR